MPLAIGSLATLALLLVLGTPAAAEEVHWGDRTVSGTEAHTGIDLVVDGNLTVADGGELTIEGSSVVVNASQADQYRLRVAEGGRLVLVDVTLGSSGGTFGLLVEGAMEVDNGSISGLKHAVWGSGTPSGLVVRGGGALALTEVTLVNDGGTALHVSGGASVQVSGGLVKGNVTALWVDGDGSVNMTEVDLEAVNGAGVVAVHGGSVVAVDCHLIIRSIFDDELRSEALVVNGSASSVDLTECVTSTSELAHVTRGASLSLEGGLHAIDVHSPFPDLVVHDATAKLTDLDIEDVNVTSGTLWLYDSTYRSGAVQLASHVHSVGVVPPIQTISLDSVLFQYYWVDFRLLDAEALPQEGISLTVLTPDQQVVVETFSGPGGWVRDVAIKSWALDGDLLTYTPSHRVEFAGPGYQITNLQVYGNATVTLWDIVGSYDLVLTTDSVRPSVSAPRANRTFDLVVNGNVLVRYPYSGGTASLDLYIDGMFHERREHPVTSAADVRFEDINLTEGEHLFQVRVDPTNEVDELNEVGNNELMFVLDVAPGSSGPGELVDLYVEMTRMRDSDGNTGQVLVPGLILVDYTVRAQNARVWPRNVPVALYVGEKREELVRVDLTSQEGNEYVFRGTFNLNLPRGDYLIRVVVDPDDEIDEEFEHNNEDQVDITLDPEADDGMGLSSTCCMALVIGGMILLTLLLGLWSNRQQQRAAEMAEGPMVGETIQYPHSSTLEAPRPPGKTPSSLEERWTVQKVDRATAEKYSVDGSAMAGAERIITHQPAAQATRERFSMSGVDCPRCGGREIVGFADGSAKCQSCKKIFYPGRRYR